MCASSMSNSASLLTGTLMSSINVQTGMSTTVHVVFMLIPAIPGPCFLCGCYGTANPLCIDQDQVYILFTWLYWWICSIMLCSHCDRVATSLLATTPKGLWSVIMWT